VAPDGATLRVTATPARHGPAGGDRGPVVGFVLAFADDPSRVLYFSGDTVWFDGIQEVATRFGVIVAVLCLGARIGAAGDQALTFTAEEAVSVARAMPGSVIVPVHFEGWEHFSETRDDVDRAFGAAGLEGRLEWAPPGEPLALRP
jgi:L-ascorbate metabolism protein UlaG (beta-lactamase superfamily)